MIYDPSGTPVTVVAVDPDGRTVLVKHPQHGTLDLPIADLRADGGQQEIDETLVAGAGTVLTMLAAEVITAVAALALMVVFAVLEAERIYSGALALGQTPDQARLIAVALVTGNAITPIYVLRNLRGQGRITRTRATVRGWLEAFWRRRRRAASPWPNSPSRLCSPWRGICRSTTRSSRAAAGPGSPGTNWTASRWA